MSYFLRLVESYFKALFPCAYSKLWRAMWVGCITFVKYRNVEFRNRFSKIGNSEAAEFFQALSKFCEYIWDEHNSKYKSWVRGSSSLYKKDKKRSSIEIFSKLKLLHWKLKKKFIAIKTFVTMASVLPISLEQSAMSTRTSQIYVRVGVLLLPFKYSILQKTVVQLLR